MEIDDFKWCLDRGYLRARINGKLKYQHVFVWEAVNGPLPKGMVVHHRNGKKADNRIDNLLAMAHSDHNTIHSLEKPVDANALLLAWAKKPKSKEHMDKIRAGQLRQYQLPPTKDMKCDVCGSVFKAYKATAQRCSVACASRHFRELRKKNQ